MTAAPTPRVAILDYGLGNLFSVLRACEAVGLSAAITSDPDSLLGADAAILPGVGAFGDAMANLRSLDLVSPLKDYVQTGKPLIGVCLGLQLLLSESYEFGRHRGLGLVEGAAIRFDPALSDDPRLKVPQVGWNRIQPPEDAAAAPPPDGPWRDPLLAGVPPGAYMYFVHSFHAVLVAGGVTTSRASYGGIWFCASLQCGQIRGYQFHPERSGRRGILIYRNLHSICAGSVVSETASLI